MSLQARLSYVTDSLKTLGYNPAMLSKDYNFLARDQQNQTMAYMTNLVAFSDEHRHDLSTSCIAYHEAESANEDEILRQLRYLAVPTAMIYHSNGAVAIWPVHSTDEKQLQVKPAVIPFLELKPYLNKHVNVFRPEMLRQVKRSSIQLGLFNTDEFLFDFAFDVTKKLLVDRFENAFVEAREIWETRLRRKIRQQEMETLTKFSIQILAARVLQDKGKLPTQTSREAATLLRAASREFPNYFDLSLMDQTPAYVSESLFKRLGENLTFQSVSHEMLGYFWSHTFIDKPEIRQQMGIYPTPPTIARHILERIPIEYLPPEKRHVIDPTCGSGSLLVAAHERLFNLLPVCEPIQIKHDYLTKHLHGIDREWLGFETARVSLLFASLPSGNSWDIAQKDFNDAYEYLPRQYYGLVVANPPFGEQRARTIRRTAENESLEWAATFLPKFLDLVAPSGYIGIILPRTFQTKRSCIQAWNELKKNFEILELIQLPEGVFPEASFATAAVIARRPPDEQIGIKQDRVFVTDFLGENKKNVQSDITKTLPSFFIADLEKPASIPAELRMPMPHAEMWERLLENGKLDQLVTFVNGVNFNTKKERQANVFDTEEAALKACPAKSKVVKFLWTSKAMRQFFLSLIYQTKDRFLTYPGSISGARLKNRDFFERDKVICLLIQNAGNPWRLEAVIDTEKIYPYKNFEILAPNTSDLSVETICAVLNSLLANCFVYFANPSNRINRLTLRNIPFPRLDDALKRQLDGMVNDMARELASLHDEHASEILTNVDMLLLDAYGLSQQERKWLQNIFEGYNRPIPFSVSKLKRTHTPYRTQLSTIPVYGEVTKIDLNNSILEIWLAGKCHDDEKMEFKINHHVPGWLLREGESFTAMMVNGISGKDIQLMKFQPMRYQYLSDEELVDRIFSNTKE